MPRLAAQQLTHAHPCLHSLGKQKWPDRQPAAARQERQDVLEPSPRRSKDLRRMPAGEARIVVVDWRYRILQSVQD